MPLSGPGPFRARADGNRFLAPLNLGLRYTDSPAAGPGLYVLWQAGHFVGVHITHHVIVCDGPRHLLVTLHLRVWCRVEEIASSGSERTAIQPSQQWGV